MDQMKREISELNESVARIDSTVTRMDATMNRVMISVAQLTGHMSEMKRDMSTKQDISDLNSRMDGFAGLLIDSRQRWAIHADTLVKHDERLNKLETKLS